MKEYNHFICISEVTIFEILRDRSDLYNIDKITVMLQKAIDIVIVLPLLDGVIVDFLDKNKIDLEHNKYQKNIIREVLNNPKKCFVVSKASEEIITKNYKLFCKFINSVIKEIYQNNKCKNCEYYYCYENIDQVTSVFITLFLINDFSLLGESSISKYLNKLNINNDDDSKIDYINNNYEKFYGKESIFRNMARFAILQKSDMNNGTLNDCLHIAYIGYVDYIVSNDKHFLNYVKNVMSLEQYLKSISIKIKWENINQ